MIHPTQQTENNKQKYLHQQAARLTGHSMTWGWPARFAAAAFDATN
jgi:hypothetical protein